MLLGKEVIDIEYATGYATAPNQTAVAGGAAIGKPFTPSPFVPPDRYGVLDISVNPATGVLNPAAKGTLMVAVSPPNPFLTSLMVSGTPANSLALNNTTVGNGFWASAGGVNGALSGTANPAGYAGNGMQLGGPLVPIPESQRGIVEQAGVGPNAFPNTTPLQYARATVVVRGPVQALCTAPNASNPINVGTLLASAGDGTLQPLPLPLSVPTIGAGTAFGSSTLSACPAWALVEVSLDGTYSAIGANFGVSGSVPISLGVVTQGTGVNNINGVLLTWIPSVDAAGYIVMRTGSAGMSGLGTPNQLGAIGFVPGGQDYFIDYGQIPLSGTSATQPFARPNAGPQPGCVQVAGAASGPASVAYRITNILANGVWGTEGTASSITTANAQLSAANGNKITWTPVSNYPLYAVDRSAALSVTNLGANSLGFIGFATSAVAINGFVDYGQQAVTFSNCVITTPNPTPRAGVVLATALGSLASATSVPTLTNVWMGNLG